MSCHEDKMVVSSDQSYLGFDFSTQQVKAVIVNDELGVLHEAQVQFDSDLPEFRTHGGVVHHEERGVVTAPTLMWVKALDMLLDRLRVCGVDFSKVAAISGTAQQHGSVYWQNNSSKVLNSLDPDRFLHEQLFGCFSVQDSPVWMDSSTSSECRHLEDHVGGPQTLAEITGSRAYERFTGPQIAKVYKSKPAAYENTERISLVSSFACSLFLGGYAPVDWADGSGTNLMDIRRKEWSSLCLEACAPDLASKLGDLVPSFKNLGTVSSYFVERFGFNSDCSVIAFTGDNPASLAGMRLHEGDVAVSLGTSDTLFIWLNEPKVVLEGHVLCNPVDQNAYMALLCFKNGSLTRERIRDKYAEGSWDMFNELLNCIPRGNFGNMGLYYDAQEIIPFVIGDHRFNKVNDKVARFTSIETEVRAVIEGQFIAKRAHAEEFGFEIGSEARIIATGGASANKAILQVLADVFNAPVYVQEAVNSAVLGAAYIAKYGLVSENQAFRDITECLPEPVQVCKPFQDAARIYNPMVERYRKIISTLKQ